jgi:hypothetical protein
MSGIGLIIKLLIGIVMAIPSIPLFFYSFTNMVNSLEIILPSLWTLCKNYLKYIAWNLKKALKDLHWGNPRDVIQGTVNLLLAGIVFIANLPEYCTRFALLLLHIASMGLVGSAVSFIPTSVTWGLNAGSEGLTDAPFVTHAEGHGHHHDHKFDLMGLIVGIVSITRQLTLSVLFLAVVGVHALCSLSGLAKTPVEELPQYYLPQFFNHTAIFGKIWAFVFKKNKPAAVGNTEQKGEAKSDSPSSEDQNFHRDLELLANPLALRVRECSLQQGDEKPDAMKVQKQVTLLRMENHLLGTTAEAHYEDPNLEQIKQLSEHRVAASVQGFFGLATSSDNHFAALAKLRRSRSS